MRKQQNEIGSVEKPGHGARLRFEQALADEIVQTDQADPEQRPEHDIRNRVIIKENHVRAKRQLQEQIDAAMEQNNKRFFHRAASFRAGSGTVSLFHIIVRQ